MKHIFFSKTLLVEYFLDGRTFERELLGEHFFIGYHFVKNNNFQSDRFVEGIFIKYIVNSIFLDGRDIK